MYATKKVLITGVTGQDGSNMTKYLLENTSHLIYGTVRRSSVTNYENLQDILENKNYANRFMIVRMDMCDEHSIRNVFIETMPDYVINFAAQSFVHESWNSPINTFNINTLGVIHFLEIIKNYKPECRFYSAGSSEEFGDVEYVPQDLKHPLKPRSPYGASKCAARHIIKVYRDSYNLYAIHSTLFNHEGIHRGKEFVTRKITSGIAKVKHQIKNNDPIIPIEIGNIYSQRDWSDSEDFVEAIWLMLNQPQPDEYLLSSDETHSVKEFIDIAVESAGLECKWDIDENNPLNTKLLYGNHPIVIINKKYYRPAEVDILHGNSSESRKKIGWEPKVSFKQLVEKMMLHDIKLLEK